MCSQSELNIKKQRLIVTLHLSLHTNKIIKITGIWQQFESMLVDNLRIPETEEETDARFPPEIQIIRHDRMT